MLRSGQGGHISSAGLRERPVHVASAAKYNTTAAVSGDTYIRREAHASRQSVRLVAGEAAHVSLSQRTHTFSGLDIASYRSVASSPARALQAMICAADAGEGQSKLPGTADECADKRRRTHASQTARIVQFASQDRGHKLEL